MKQVKVLDKTTHDIIGGIRLDNGDLILCDVGDYIKSDEIAENGKYEIQEVFECWVNLTEEIIGD